MVHSHGPFHQRGLAAGRPKARAAGGLRHGLRKSGVARGGAPGRNGSFRDGSERNNWVATVATAATGGEKTKTWENGGRTWKTW